MLPYSCWKLLMLEMSKSKPVQAVIASENQSFQLNEEALSKVLLHPDIKDKPVVVVSVAGAFRKGKSFLLGFFLRYMKAKYSTVNVGARTANWLGAPDEPLEGFSWRGGCDRDTTGIDVWSEVFVATLQTGERVAVVLMVTQGTFDGNSTVKDCATVFALSTMLSSVQIYNLSQNIQEDDLMNLELFTEYGKLALKESGQTPFQKLLFLVRDWSYPYEHEYGIKGGNELLEKRLAIETQQGSDHQALRRHIKECFNDISCFLMPDPGSVVRTDRYFTGSLNEIDYEFLNYVEVLVPLILSPKNLVVKKICGQKIRSGELFEYFKSYMEIFNSGELPEPKTVLAATADANNMAAFMAAKEEYSRLMEEVCRPNAPCLDLDEFEAVHQCATAEAIAVFDKRPKMGSEERSSVYRERLRVTFMESYDVYKEHNEGKSVVFTLSHVIAASISELVSLASINNVNKEALYRVSQNFLQLRTTAM